MFGIQRSLAPSSLPTNLQTGQPKECELKRVRMASIRQRLGLTQGGAKALSVLAMMSGSDYDLDGAQGVGSVGGLALARHLLQGDSDDGRVLERLAALVQVRGGGSGDAFGSWAASSKDVGMIAAGQLEVCSAWWDTGNIKLF